FITLRFHYVRNDGVFKESIDLRIVYSMISQSSIFTTSIYYPFPAKSLLSNKSLFSCPKQYVVFKFRVCDGNAFNFYCISFYNTDFILSLSYVYKIKKSNYTY